MVRASPRVDLALGGSYRAHVLAHNPTAWYRFAETNAATVARDSSGHGYHGTITGGVTLEQAPTVPEGGYAYAFATNGRIAVTLPATTTTVSFEFWIKPQTQPGGTLGTILTDAGVTHGLFQTPSTDRRVNLYYLGTSHYSTAALTDLAWSHVLVSIAAGTATFYINGAASGSATSFPGFTPTQIGSFPSPGNVLKATLDELVVYPTALTAADALAHYNAGRWTDVSADVLGGDTTVSSKFGISGNGPTDRFADAGPGQFTLRNDAFGARPAGYYSPRHANCRAGFTNGILARIVYPYNGTDYPRYLGKVKTIDPAPGTYRSRRTLVTLSDLQDDLAEAVLRNVTLQTNKTEAELLQTVIDALPVTSQPLAVDLDGGLDTSPYAFDTLGAGQVALQPVGEITISSLGFQFITDAGVFRYENRNARTLRMSVLTLADTELEDLVAPTGLEQVFNEIRITYTPKRIDAAATTVLWSLAAGTSLPIAAGETIEVWGDYYKATDPQVKIGGTAQVTPVITTDFLAFANADGTGTNLSATLTVVAEWFASTVKWTITQTGITSGHITKLQLRGKGLYADAPVTVPSTSVQPYGSRELAITLPYLTDLNKAQGLADYLRAQYENNVDTALSLAFWANRNDTLMVGALTAQIGQRITVSEPQLGLTLVDAFVQSVDLTASKGGLLLCRFGLAATSFFDADDLWVMDDLVLSVADSTTIFGFA